MGCHPLVPAPIRSYPVSDGELATLNPQPAPFMAPALRRGIRWSLVSGDAPDSTGCRVIGAMASCHQIDVRPVFISGTNQQSYRV